MREKNNISINTVTSLVLQLMITVQGLIIPKIMLSYFGSGINGLVSSLTQYLNLFAIVEGGISGVVLAALYKPLAQKKNDELSSNIVSANLFMRKLGILFVGYAIMLALMYPLFVHTYPYFFVFSLTLVIAISIFAQYFFTLIPQLILRADDKFYICNEVQILFVFCNILLSLISVRIYPEVRILKLVSSIAYLIQPFVLIKYVKNRYEVNWNAPQNKSLLKQRWDGFEISLANLVATNTDVIVLTAFSTLETVSVYTIYSQILVAIKGLVNSVTNGFQAQIGQLYAKEDYEKLNKQFALYEYSTNIVAGILVTCCAEMIVPFVLIYTNGVTDANYNVPLFAFLITLSILLVCIREPYIQMTYCAGFFKRTSKYAFIEAALNICISILLVLQLGLVGVAIGTIISVLYRHIVTVMFIKNNILNRKIGLYLMAFGVEIGAFFMAYIISFCVMPFTADNVLAWVIDSCVCVVINAVVFLCAFGLFYRAETVELLSFLKKDKKMKIL